MGKAKEWKWGYISPSGDFVIPPVFDGASAFSEGLAAVKTDWARGYINRKGEFVIPPAFEAAESFKEGVAIVKLDDKVCLIDKEGNLLDSSIPPVESKIEVGFDPKYDLHDGLVRFVEDNKFGYKDEYGEVKINPKFLEASDFSEGLACVKRSKTSPWGYIDTSGRMVIPSLFRQAGMFKEGLAAVLISVD